MDLGQVSVVFLVAVAGFVALFKLLKNFNGWFYETSLGEKRYSLPPGDLGWPLIGNMWSFLRAFKSSNPDSFISSFVTRFDRTGIYKAFMFGSPTILITTPETCKQVLMDDERFVPGWPEATGELIGRKSFLFIVNEEHKRLRKLTMGPVNGHEALSVYIKYIEECMVAALENWAELDRIEFLTELRRLTFKIIMYIFLGSESELIMQGLEKEYTLLNHGVRAMAINIPGFAYHKALKARKRLVAILQSAVTKRRNQKSRDQPRAEKDMMDVLLDAEDDKGQKLDDEEIIDILVMYLNAGHESSGHTTMWATVLLQKHPEFFQKAKEEQEEIIRNRPAGQKGLSLKEVRKMDYLSQVIDETLRLVSFSYVVFREAVCDVKINGYIIPKGWKVQAWFRTIHMDDQVYPQPKEFNPSRWEGLIPKVGAFVPFGGGARLCPGNDLAKMEISIFLHHFLLNYKLERFDPDCAVGYLPHPRPKDNCQARIIKLKPTKPYAGK